MRGEEEEKEEYEEGLEKRSIEEHLRGRKVQRTGVKNLSGPPKGKGEATHCILDI